ncbi:glycosyltransferase [Cohnella herbarum]|uniref:Glycosyltransferase n=1 Tax=Cohnella herbarum TaxID=2728023 RepID=A0A7Z2ZJL7_9BACL|nr:glycosyltransferase [Cohnella herbarum]QJD81935.1 glycosyltransferase [Cohnella herbarum]
MISVIMPTFNKAAYLNLTLASFVRQTSKDYEIVLIDDGSGDGTQAIADNYKNKLNLIRLKQANLGRSAARNKGISASSGEYLLFNDDDRIVRGDFIERHQSALSREANTVHIGGKGRVLTIWRRNQLIMQGQDRRKLAEQLGDRWHRVRRKTYAELASAEEVETNFEHTIERLFLGKEFESNHALGVPIDRIEDFRLKWMLGTTANLSVRKDAVVEAGMFDTEFRGWGMEDSELCYRLVRNGLALKECPEAFNYHQIHPIGRKFWINPTLSISRMNELKRNIDYFHAKFGTPASYIFRRAFYDNIPTLLANEILIQFEGALGESGTVEDWDSLYRTIMRSRRNRSLGARFGIRSRG